MRNREDAAKPATELHRVRLQRIIDDQVRTFGVLLVDESPIAVTLEPSWHGNQRGISCIPAGEYLVERYNHPHRGEVYWIRGVPDRDPIYFHAGNRAADTAGCVLVGQRWGTLDDEPAILQSKLGLRDLFRAVGDAESFRLEVG